LGKKILHPQKHSISYSYASMPVYLLPILLIVLTFLNYVALFAVIAMETGIQFLTVQDFKKFRVQNLRYSQSIHLGRPSS